ncbi:hypothetical protein BDR03DRAFT_1009491 [Suillus americanus]|nr:hypothetical protein BDR03DRAFT_1009491 [Suillus americanus]
MPLIPEILLTIVQLVFQQALHANDFTDFINLTTANKVFFELATPILWRELPSAQPLLHLLPSNVVVRFLDRDLSGDTKWHYKLRRIPLVTDLDRLLTYAPHIRAIRARTRPSLNSSAHLTFDKLFQNNLSIPTFPRLEHLQLTDSSDSLVLYIPSLLHQSLRILELPYYATGLQLAFAHLLAGIPPPLHTLVYVDRPLRMQQFAQSIHLFPLLRNLTVSLLDPVAMQAIVSLPFMHSLEIVIDAAFDATSTHPYTFHSHRPISSLTFAIVDSPLSRRNPAIHDDSLSLRALLRAFPLPCHQLTIVLPHRFQSYFAGPEIKSLEQYLNPSTALSVKIAPTSARRSNA